MSYKPTGVELIAAERSRQIDSEGYDASHDDAHVGGELAWAATCYAAPHGFVYQLVRRAASFQFKDPWPWRHHEDARKPRGGNFPEAQPPTGPYRIRMLVKAGALIAAEIDRLQRREAA